MLRFDSVPRKLAEDVIFNTHSNALAELISYFEETKSSSSSSTKRIQVDPTWEASQRCYFKIVNRLKDGIENDVVVSNI